MCNTSLPQDGHVPSNMGTTINCTLQLKFEEAKAYLDALQSHAMSVNAGGITDCCSLHEVLKAISSLHRLTTSVLLDHARQSAKEQASDWAMSAQGFDKELQAWTFAHRKILIAATPQATGAHFLLLVRY